MGVLGGLGLAVLTGDGHAAVLNDDTVSPGLIGSAVVAVMVVAVVFLLRSFVKQLRKLPPQAPRQAPPIDSGAQSSQGAESG